MNLSKEIKNCKLCPLHKDMPEGCHPVPGDGPIGADLMICGEALGKNEALLELPFQGMAGKMLDKMLEEANISRKETFITNCVHCRPTKNNGKSNRPPTDAEIEMCKGWLYDEIYVVKPKVILTLGKIPTRTLLYGSQHMKNKTFTLKDMIGRQYAINKSTVIPAYHPSFLLQHGRKQVDRNIEIFKLVKELI